MISNQDITVSNIAALAARALGLRPERYVSRLPAGAYSTRPKVA